MRDLFRECFERIEGFRSIKFTKQKIPEDDFELVLHYERQCALVWYIDYPIKAVNMQEGDVVSGSSYRNTQTGEKIVVLKINDYAYIGRHETAVELFSQVLDDDDKEARVIVH